MSTLTIPFLENASQLFELSKKCFVSNAGISPIKEAVFNAYFVEHVHKNAFHVLILSRLVDTFISRISLTMLPVPNPHNTVCVLSGEEARHWQSRSSGYSSS